MLIVDNKDHGVAHTHAHMRALDAIGGGVAATVDAAGHGVTSRVRDVIGGSAAVLPGVHAGRPHASFTGNAPGSKVARTPRWAWVCGRGASRHTASDRL